MSYNTNLQENNAALQNILEQVNELPESDSSGGLDLGITGATVGQTVKITEVDENGVPTAWEPVDFPNGGGGEEWEHITTIDLTEEVSIIDISTDANGNQFSLKKIHVHIYHPKYEGGSDFPNYSFTNINNKVSGIYTSFNPVPDKTYKSVHTLEVEIRGKNFVQYITGIAKNFGTENYAERPGQTWFRKLDETIETITRINFSPNNGILGFAGTHIVVYGVRA